jgi:predicted metal-dependent hydrolase
VGRNNEMKLNFFFKKRTVKRVVRRRVRNGMVKHTKTEEKRLRVLAKQIVIEKVEQFNQYYKFEYGKIFIKNQGTRWGSCSSKKNLNFNYRIAVLPPELQDYLIVHELCHLKEFNHGNAFWDLVGEQVANAKDVDKKLKTFSFSNS